MTFVWILEQFFGCTAEDAHPLDRQAVNVITTIFVLSTVIFLRILALCGCRAPPMTRGARYSRRVAAAAERVIAEEPIDVAVLSADIKKQNKKRE